MCQAGVEPATDGLEDHCSILLSYWHLIEPNYYKDSLAESQRLKAWAQLFTLEAL